MRTPFFENLQLIVHTGEVVPVQRRELADLSLILLTGSVQASTPYGALHPPLLLPGFRQAGELRRRPGICSRLRGWARTHSEDNPHPILIPTSCPGRRGSLG